MFHIIIWESYLIIMSNYRYNAESWLEGEISWTSIECYVDEGNYISQECIVKIQSKQSEIFKDEVKRYAEVIIEKYAKFHRKETNRKSLVGKWLKTIDNLFEGSIKDFDETILLEDEHSQFPLEIRKKKIPPLDWFYYSQNELIGVQKYYKEFLRLSQWDISEVDTPNTIELWKNMDFKSVVLAATYYKILQRLRRSNGIVYNSFFSDVPKYKLASLRVDLIKYNFISKDSDRELFIKTFNGYYLLNSERIVWLQTLDCLRYFITQINGCFSINKEYGLWGTVCNCFQSEDGNINSKTLRKADRINKSPELKIKLDKLAKILI